MAEPAAVGVAIATRDRRARVLATLDRLAELPEAPPVVVVDNASRDATAAAIAERHPNVTVIQLDRNAGAAARTVAARALATPLIAFSDDDSWWAPGALDRAARTLDAHPAVALIAARILVGSNQHLDPTCEAMRRSPLRAPGGAGPAVLGFVACGAIVRRQAFLDVGGFNPRIGIAGEESLLALDLAAAGWALVYCDSIVAHHHPESTDPRPGRADLQLRNAIWSAWLRRRLPHAIGQTATLVATGLRARRHGALLAAARGMPGVLRERRPIPRSLERSLRRL